MRSAHVLFCVSQLLLLGVSAWGAVGHEVVATIAQIHLHESTKETVQGLLPEYAKGSMSRIASWPDRVKRFPQYRWSSPLHYTSLEDVAEGKEADMDILHAIHNFSRRVEQSDTDWQSFNFLVHFIGDLHQPLHLTREERGGNGISVLFEGRKTNLHSVWDSLLISRALREQTNYTNPLPVPQIESVLRGTIYDPYIRLLLWQGVREWWRGAIDGWLDCPPALVRKRNQIVLSPSLRGDAAVVCPLTWAYSVSNATHDYIYPAHFNKTDPPVELGTQAYYGVIQDNNIVEKSLVQGGLRLAATLNYLFRDPSDSVASDDGYDGLLNMSWLA